MTGNPWEVQKGIRPVTKSPTSGKANQLLFSQIIGEPSHYFLEE